MKRTVTVEKAVEILNEALVADPDAVNDLFDHRTKCNQELAMHRSVQVAGDGCVGLENNTVGILGIINGIFGIDDESWGAVVAKYDLLCGCPKTPDEAELGGVCVGCGGEVTLGEIIEFLDNGREVGHK